MRLPDRLAHNWSVLAEEASLVASGASRRARAWSERVASHFESGPFRARPGADWRDGAGDRAEEDDWRTTAGVDAARTLPVAAPADFTSMVMARISAQQSREVSAPVPVVWTPAEPLRVLVGTVGISAMVALISSCALAILAPSEALALLAWTLSAGAALLVLLRDAFGLAAGTLASAAMLLVLGAAGAVGSLAVAAFASLRGGESIHEA